MALNRSPLFPGKPEQSVIVAAASTIAAVQLLNGENDGRMISSINLYETGSGVVQFRLTLTVGVTNVTIASGVTTGVQGSATELIRSSLIPSVDPNDPYFMLGKNAILRLEVLNSVANALHLVVTHASFTLEA